MQFCGKEKNVTVEKPKKKKKAWIIVYFYMVLILLILLTAASYTWFARSKLNRVSNLSIYVNTPVGLQIALSPDSEEWGQQLSWLDMVSETSPLRPVTWSDKDQMFYAAVYGIDGRLTGKWQALSDERNANRTNYEGYYCIATFYAKTDERVNVSLAPPVAIDGGENGSGTYLIGMPIWDAENVEHHNGGEGAENAVRIGIKITRLGEDHQPIDEAPQFYIYEPNSDTHADGSTGYIATPSIDGTESLVPAEQLIPQTATTLSEADPVQKDVQLHTFGEFTADTDLFSLDADEMVMIQLYIWLEGQDVDCTNAIEEAQIMANIQFSSTTEHQSGMVPVDKSDATAEEETVTDEE